jgi:hypothetical protein
MNNKRIIPWISAALLMICLTGCYIPEDYQVRVSIDKKGNYAFTYSGKLTNVLALASAFEGKLGKKEEDELQKDAAKLAELPGFKKVKYLKEGRYEVTVDRKGKAGEDYHFISKDINIFFIQYFPGGRMKISAFKPKKDEIAQIKAMGGNMSGTLTVSLPKGLKVIEHNAISAPKGSAAGGEYIWNIDHFDLRPEIVIEF